ncbi:MAG: hypothetical protein ACI9XO_002423 [Paraglaciecola sp.]|jgi:hypothetical protein
MASFRIFKSPKPRHFNFIPRYYDPEEEERQAGRDRRAKLREDTMEGRKERISSGLKYRGGYTSDRTIRKQAIRKSNFVMLGVLVFLMVLTYGFIRVYLPQIMEALQ